MTENTRKPTPAEQYIAQAETILDGLSKLAAADATLREDREFKMYQRFLNLAHIHLRGYLSNAAELVKKIGEGYNVESQIEQFVGSEAAVNVAAQVIDLLTGEGDLNYDAANARVKDRAVTMALRFRHSRSTSVVRNFSENATAEVWAEYARMATGTF